MHLSERTTFKCTVAPFSVSEYELKEESGDVEAQQEAAGEDDILSTLLQRRYDLP